MVGWSDVNQDYKHSRLDVPVGAPPQPASRAAHSLKQLQDLSSFSLNSVSFGIVSCYTKMTGAEKHAGSCSPEQKTDPFMRRFSVTTQSGAFRYLMEV